MENLIMVWGLIIRVWTWVHLLSHTPGQFKQPSFILASLAYQFVSCACIYFVNPTRWQDCQTIAQTEVRRYWKHAAYMIQTAHEANPVLCVRGRWIEILLNVIAIVLLVAQLLLKGTYVLDPPAILLACTLLYLGAKWEQWPCSLLWLVYKA
jgi:hypothetical protein